MDSASLRIFEAVARLGGMSSAAADLNTVQSNVTARIKALEDELGVALFERSNRGATLTAAGRRLLPIAEQIARLLHDARRAAQDEGTPSGGLAIGALETTTALRLSPILAGYAKTYPDVDLVIRTGTSGELIEHVLDGRVEGAFVCGPVDHPELDARLFFREELMLAGGAGIGSLDDVAKAKRLKILVLRIGCSYRQRLEDLLARRGQVGVRLVEFGTLEAILACVAAGVGVTLLPRIVLEKARGNHALTLHALPPAEAMVETLFVRRKDAFLSSALAAFLDAAQPQAPRIAAE